MSAKPRIMLSVCVVYLAIFANVGAVFAQPPLASDRVSTVLEWLPPDSETLIVANGPFLMPGEVDHQKEGVELARTLPFSIYSELKNGLILKPFEGRKVAFALEASRRFTSPVSLGLMLFEGSLLVQFEEQEHDSLAANVLRCFESADKRIKVKELDVGVFDQGWEAEIADDGWSIFVALPRPGVLLATTSQKFLEEMLGRMNNMAAGERAFPTDLPEWKAVDTGAAVWGIRHYGEEFALFDPSSPLRPPAAGNVPDPKAIGFVFWVDEDPKKPSQIRYLSTSETALDIFSSGWHYLPAANFVAAKPNIIEANSPTDSTFMFVLMMYLGHGIYV